jgi:predicted RNA-binding Zn ribbon-like protein
MAVAPKANFIADHVVLDLLNTVVMVDGRLVDTLEGDEDVLEWLRRAGFSETIGRSHAFAAGTIVGAARELREIIREAVVRRKSGMQIGLRSLNGVLAKTPSYLCLGAQQGEISLQRVWKGETANRLFGPLAEAAAELLVSGDFSLVRKCESDSCVLWFYDRTKSHHRRWCSVSTCGNRAKVAAFRRRQAEAKKTRIRGNHRRAGRPGP